MVRTRGIEERMINFIIFFILMFLMYIFGVWFIFSIGDRECWVQFFVVIFFIILFIAYGVYNTVIIP